MQIDGVSSQGPGVHPLGKLHPKDQQAEEPPDSPLTEQESTVQQTTESSDSDGVLRLLQEGHFKGVSDIRLRINFYNELAAIEAQQLQAAAEEQIDSILQSVGSIVGTMIEESVPPPQSTPVQLPPPPSPVPQQAPSPVLLLEPPPVDANGDGVIDSFQAIIVKVLTVTNEPPPPPPDLAQLQETFTETVNQLKDDFLTAEAPSTDTLMEGIQSAFDQLVASLEGSLTPPPDTQQALAAPIDGLSGDISKSPPPPSTESESETQPIIEDLTAAFDTAMAELMNAFEEVTVLSPTSEPKGNGGAYNKFLNIYNEMRDL